MANLYVTITEEITLPNTTTEKTQTFKIINGINQIVRRVDTITTAFSGSGIEIIRFCNSEAEQTGGAFVKQDVQYIRITNLSTQYDTLIYLVDPAEMDFHIDKQRKPFLYHIKEVASVGMEKVKNDLINL